MTYTFEGKIKTIYDTLTFESGFKKREIVVTSINEEYPQDVKFEFLKDTVSKLDGLKIGDTVSIAFNIKGNEYQGKHYNNLVAFAIGILNSDGSIKAKPIEVVKDKKTSSKNNITQIDENDDDLPF